MLKRRERESGMQWVWFVVERLTVIRVGSDRLTRRASGGGRVTGGGGVPSASLAAYAGDHHNHHTGTHTRSQPGAVIPMTRRSSHTQPVTRQIAPAPERGALSRRFIHTLHISHSMRSYGVLYAVAQFGSCGAPRRRRARCWSWRDESA